MEDKDIMNQGDSDNTITIDYIGTSEPALNTLSLDLSDTITLGSGSSYAFSNGSPCVITYPSYTTTMSGLGVSGYGTTYQSQVNIDADGVKIKEGGDLFIGNISLKNFVAKMEQRLAILTPDPAKLEKFEALKRAYEHYKTMESLCFDEPDQEKND